MKNKARLLGGIFVILVIAQMILAIVRAPIDTYALEKLKYSVVVFDGGGFTLSHPYMSLIGLISRVVNLHPLVFANTVMTIVIAVAYGAYYLLLGEVLEDGIKKYTALILICILNVWGYQSPKAVSVSLLTGYFTGTAFAVHVILPLGTYLAIKNSEKIKAFYEEKIKASNASLNDINDGARTAVDENGGIDDFYQEEWDMKKHPIVNARNLAIALSVVVIALLAIVYVLNNKINTLYDATVNLQNEINSSCKTYEYAPAGELEAYIIKNTDGSIAVIGGGNADDESALCDYIKSFGTVVDTWYLNGADAESQEAYNYCITSGGIEVKNVILAGED